MEKMLKNIADNYNIKMVIGTDSHYLRPEDRPVHKAYLTSDMVNSAGREVDAFYKFTYLMSGEEIKNLMSYSFDEEHIDIEKQYWEKFHIDELLRKTNKKRNSQTETQVFNA